MDEDSNYDDATEEKINCSSKVPKRRVPTGKGRGRPTRKMKGRGVEEHLGCILPSQKLRRDPTTRRKEGFPVVFLFHFVVLVVEIKYLFIHQCWKFLEKKEGLL